MAKTTIEYLTHTWNPIVMRCSRVSAGCANCWHLRMCDRMRANPTIPVWKQDIYAGNARARIDEKALVQPIHVKKPSIFGVQFMGDLFRESVFNEMIRDVFEVIKNESQHTFLVLTKRPLRMFDLGLQIDYKLPNLWLGVSVEDQESADERIPTLLETPAAHRWVSVEPMIGPVILSDGLDWIVCGGETGPGARPVHPDWVRSLRDQSQASNVPFFFKNWGAHPRFQHDDNGVFRQIDDRTWDEVPWGDHSGSISEICRG